MSENLDLPSLTLIFSVEDETADWDVLLELSRVAYDAIEKADPRFSILKSFTFYAGGDYDSDRRKLQRVRELVDHAGKCTWGLARDIREVIGEPDER